MANSSSSGTAWEALRRRVLDRDGWTCQACGKHLQGADATVDHILAKKNGGVDSMWNCVAMCRSCNAIKGARVYVRQNYFNPKWLDRL